ncbi:hypothetical protein D918_07424 [Trichuris suis]|nr:hypothetical protein D918_07424 [Trichuris suis]
MSSGPKESREATSAAMSVKLPFFWPQVPTLWFAQAEAQFNLLKVTSSITKYYYTIASLPDSIAVEVEDLLTLATADPYLHLKMALLARFSRTEEDRFQTLMHSASSDAQKPTQLLREMRLTGMRLLDPNGPLLERLFLERLPVNIRLLLKAGPTTLLMRWPPAQMIS